jgi:hypothetical protein
MYAVGITVFNNIQNFINGNLNYKSRSSERMMQIIHKKEFNGFFSCFLFWPVICITNGGRFVSPFKFHGGFYGFATSQPKARTRLGSSSAVLGRLVGPRHRLGCNRLHQLSGFGRRSSGAHGDIVRRGERSASVALANGREAAAFWRRRQIQNPIWNIA